MSEMSDLFDSLDTGDLDEIAGKLNVSQPKRAPEPQQVVEEVQPAVEQKKERKYVKFEKLNEQVSDLFDNYDLPSETVVPKPKPKPAQTKPRESFVENAARALSLQVKITFVANSGVFNIGANNKPIPLISIISGCCNSLRISCSLC